jgi:hypothetical protein
MSVAELDGSKTVRVVRQQNKRFPQYDRFSSTKFQLRNRSCLARNPFIRVNGAAILASLIASELFGHEKGANLQISKARLKTQSAG